MRGIVRAHSFMPHDLQLAVSYEGKVLGGLLSDASKEEIRLGP
jgi:hypothetical protein